MALQCFYKISFWQEAFSPVYMAMKNILEQKQAVQVLSQVAGYTLTETHPLFQWKKPAEQKSLTISHGSFHKKW